MTPEQREELKAAAQAASPGPWKGDRYDGTVKYELLDANDNTVIMGDNNNNPDGPFGINNYKDEVYLKVAHPSAILSLIAQVEALTVPQGDTSTQLIEKISALIDEQEQSYQWGGDEDADGGLMPGDVDFKSLRAGIAVLLAPTIPAIPGTKEAT